MYDGGVRSLALVSGPRVPAEARGSRYKGLMHAVDLTALALHAGRVLPEAREQLALDGMDLTALVYGLTTSGGRQVVPINILRGGRSYSAVRFGKYKVIVDDNKQAVRCVVVHGCGSAH
jgi:hypothetical protein